MHSRIHTYVLYRYIRGIKITGWDGSIRMVAGESSGEPSFRGYRGGWEQMTAMLLKIESSYIGYRADFTPISIDFCNVTVPSFSISTTVVTILLGITHRKRFCPSSREMPARGSSFRREPFYLGSGQGRRRVSHAAHRAATINDRRVIKVGQCPSVIITRVISNSAIVVRG